MLSSGPDSAINLMSISRIPLLPSLVLAEALPALLAPGYSGPGDPLEKALF